MSGYVASARFHVARYFYAPPDTAVHGFPRRPETRAVRPHRFIDPLAGALRNGAMQILIAVKNRNKQYARNVGRSVNVMIDVRNDGTIGDVAHALSVKLNVPQYCFALIFCGRKLANDTPISALFLGPQTSLTAVIAELLCTSERDEKAENPSSSSSAVKQISGIASFYVFCKNCNSLKRAKLRVYCAECSSSSVLATRDPACWSDVLEIDAIRVDCKDCEKETSARFCFKCIDCGQVAVPLTHIRGFRGEDTCPICYDSDMKVVVQLNCHHQTCVDCFTAYIKTAFAENHFAFFPPNGYTVGCPVYGCRACVVDTHCFYLLGKSKYDEYQQQAAERFVSLEQEGLFCPRTNCGAAFLWEYDPSNRTAVCPECYFSFCVICRRQECVCFEADATKATVERICRKCPSCGTQTERNGGCAHMHCLQCGVHWCFLCGKLWSEDCQWDHWFD